VHNLPVMTVQYGTIRYNVLELDRFNSVERNFYMYITVQNTAYVHHRIDEISVTSGLHVSAVKQPSAPKRTQFVPLVFHNLSFIVIIARKILFFCR